MNDFIEKQPIKCFYTPFYDYKENKEKISYTFGQNRIFKIGDNVPSQTFWYNYSENFMILDYEYSKINPLIHIVKNDKLKKTVFINELTMIDFFSNEKIVTTYGEELNINSLDGLNLFLNDLIELDGLCEFKSSKIDIYRDNLLKRNIEIQLLTENPKYCMSCISNRDKEALYNLLINYKTHIPFDEMSDILDVIYDYKEEIIMDDRLIDKIKEIVLERFKKEANTLYIENERLENEINKEIKILEKEHKEKWFNIKFEKEKTFGEYLECYRYLKSCENVYEKDSNLIKELESCICNFSKFITQNKDIVDRYLIWSNFDNETQELIKQIIDDIINKKIEA